MVTTNPKNPLNATDGASKGLGAGESSKDEVATQRELLDNKDDLRAHDEFSKGGDYTPTFTYFPKLPKEIRLEVLGAAFPLLRPFSLNIEMNYSNKIWRVGSDLAKKEALASLPPRLVTLNINKESRMKTLRHYIVTCNQDLSYYPFSPLVFRFA